MIKIALAEDQNLVREAFSSILNSEENIQITHLAENGLDLITQLQQSEIKPDIVLMDIEMPVMNGFETTKELQKILPNCKIIYLSVYDNPYYIEKAIQSSAHGYLCKDTSFENLIEAIKKVSESGFYFNEHLSYKRLNNFILSQRNNPNELLTAREIEYVRYLCTEKTDPEIAQLMNIKKSTAQGYRKIIMKKINVKKTAGIVLYATNQNLIQKAQTKTDKN